MPERRAAIPPDTVRLLAERFGLTQSAIEEILHGTHEEYPETTLPPVATPSAAIEHAAAHLPDTIENVPVADAAKVDAPIAEAVVAEAPNAGLPPAAITPPVAVAPPVAAAPAPVSSSGFMDNPTAAATPRMGQQPNMPPGQRSNMPIGAGFMMAVVVALLITVGIAMSFRHGCFEQRHVRTAAPQVDTISSLLAQQAEKASTPPERPSSQPADSIPPESLVVPAEVPHSQIPPKTSHNAPTRSAAPRPRLETPSNFEAQEQLAELRAEGNTKAHLKKVVKHGVTTFQLFTK